MNKPFSSPDFFSCPSWVQFILRALGGTLFLNIISVILAFILQFLLARILGVEGLGWFMLGMAWISILSILCLCGFSVSVIRYSGEYLQDGRYNLLNGLLKRAVQITLLISIVIAILALCVLWLFYEPFSLVFNTLGLAFLILPVWCVMILRQGMMRAFKLVVKAKIPENLMRPAGAIVLCLFLYIIQDMNLRADQAMLMNALAVLIAVFFSNRWFDQVRPHAAKDISPDFKTREWLRVSLPMTLTTWIPTFLRRSDLIMIGMFLDAAAVGIYSVALALAAVVQMAFNSVVNVVAPLYAEHHFKEDIPALRKIYLLSLALISGLTLLGTLFMALAGPYILSVFGQAFNAGYTAFLILLAGQMLGSLSGTPESFLSMTERQNTLARWFIIAAIFNLGLNVPLIHFYGIEGAAFATATTTVLLKSVLSFYVWRAFRQA